MEVARAWLAHVPAMPPEVEAALVAHPDFGTVSEWRAEPEARLSFDSYPGEPRNTDLLVLANDSRGSYVLAVEAKADESYGETVAEAFAAALERRVENPRSNGIARIVGLVTLLSAPRRKGLPKIADLRYQLFTACAGAVAEAGRRGCSRAVMLVHEFITTATTDAAHERNAEDLERFLARLGRKTDEAPGSALHGPFAHQGTEGVQLYVGKVARHMR